MGTDQKWILFIICICAALASGCGSGGKDEPTGVVGIPPSVSLGYPSGGEILKGGGQIIISWAASDDKDLGASPITLEYGDQGNFTVIESGVANTGTYLWTVEPALNSMNVQIRVKVTDSDGNTSKSTSDAFIVDSAPPILTVEDPDPAGSVAPGTEIEIKWVAIDMNFGDNPILIEYEHPVSTWNTVDSPVAASPGKYTWDVPGLDNAAVTNVKIRITATDQAGNQTAVIPAATLDVSPEVIQPWTVGIYYGVDDAEKDYQSLDGAGPIGRAEIFTIRFSESMDRAATETATTLDLDGAPILLDYFWTSTSDTDDTLVVTPKDDILEDDTGVNYILDVDEATATDKAGNLLTNTTVNTAAFTTTADTTPSQVTTAVVQYGGIDGDNLMAADPKNKILTTGNVDGFDFTFNEIVIFDDFKIEGLMGEVISSNQWRNSGILNNVRIELDLDRDNNWSEGNGDDDLAPGYGYEIIVRVNDTLGNHSEHRFTVVIDQAATSNGPYITGTIPDNGETNTQTNYPLYIVFSEAVNPATVKNGLNIKVDGLDKTIEDFTIRGGNLVWLTLQGGIDGDSTVTIDVNDQLQDAADSQGVAGVNVISFDTGPDDTTGPQIFSCTVKEGDTDIDQEFAAVINLNEPIDNSTVDEFTVYVKDALTNVPFRCFDVEVEEGQPSGIIRMSYNWKLGPNLAFDRDYILVVNGVADLNGNLSDIEIPFRTVVNSSTNTMPPVGRIGAGLSKAPEFSILGNFKYGGTVNSVTLFAGLRHTEPDDNLIVTVTDGAYIWNRFANLGGSLLYQSGFDIKVYDHDDGWDPVFGDPGSTGLLMYWDKNTNFRWDQKEDIWLDNGTTADEYDAADTPVFNNGDGWDVLEGQAGINNGLKFHDVDDDGTYNAGDDIWAETIPLFYGKYDVSDLRIEDHGNGWDPVFMDDGYNGPLMYEDKDDENIGQWDPGEDIWLDDGSTAEEYDAGDTQIFDNGDGWDVAMGTKGQNSGLFFHNATADDVYSPGVDDIWASGVNLSPGLYDGYDSITPGPGVFEFTIKDGNGHTVTFKQTYFMPGEMPVQTSPSNLEELDSLDPVDMTWTLPNGGAGYPNTAILVALTNEPGGKGDDNNQMIPMDYLPLMVGGGDNSVTVPEDFFLQPGLYFWSLNVLSLGTDTMSLAMQADNSLSDSFMYIDYTQNSISGQVTQSGGVTDGLVVVIAISTAGGGGPAGLTTLTDVNQPYTISGLPDGDYYIYSWRDADGDLNESEGEGYGEIAGMITVAGGTDYPGNDIDLDALAFYTISGTVTQTAGTAGGDILIEINSDFPRESEKIRINAAGGGPWDYAATGIRNGTYNIYMFRDTDGDEYPTGGEGEGSLSGVVVNDADIPSAHVAIDTVIP